MKEADRAPQKGGMPQIVMNGMGLWHSNIKIKCRQGNEDEDKERHTKTDS